MATTIIQQPLYRMLAADEEIIFAVENSTIVATKFKVKFVAKLYVGTGGGGIFTQTKIATLKATPNNVGVGIFDFSRILESYVSPDYLGGYTITSGTGDHFTEMAGVSFDTVPHSIHQIDKHSLNRKACRMFGVKFHIEYADAIDEAVVNTSSSPTLSETYYIHNATRQEDELIGFEQQRGWFGYNYYWNDFVMLDVNGKFLTNAPTTQYVSENDYCTLAYFNQSDDKVGENSLLGNSIGTGGVTRTIVKKIRISFYNQSSVQTGAYLDYSNDKLNGSLSWTTASPRGRIQYTGVGPANIRNNIGTVPYNNYGDWLYYTVQAYDDDDEEISQDYKFYKQEVCKGFEKIRLTWLNRLGVWDYFNFTKKNVRKVNSKRETYQQIKGSWNEATYIKHGHEGGTKTFKTNSKEVVTLQTDYITEEEAAWLEELFTSTDVFVLPEFTTIVAQSTAGPSSSVSNIINKYIQPCFIKTSSYTRKTTANDKLKQYTIEIEMSHKKRIQKA